MNCSQAQVMLPALVYEELAAEEAALLDAHVTGCPQCRHELQALRHVQQMLDRLPVPDARIDLGRLYREASEEMQARLRWWRRTTWGALASAAALILLLLFTRLEIRLSAHELVLCWGTPAPQKSVSASVPAVPTNSVQTEEQLVLLGQLIQMLAQDFETRDRRQQESIAIVQAQLREFQRRVAQQWTATERDVAALYAAQFSSDKKGSTQ